MTGTPHLLEVERLVAGYEIGTPVVNGASIHADQGEIVAILGPNGAGKSTLIKSVAGVVPASSGRVSFAGTDITRLPAHSMVRRGLAFVPQTDNVFAGMTVGDNLRLAAHALAPGRRASRVAEVAAAFPVLHDKSDVLAGRLSGGQRQMLAVARALLVAPRLLLLDEPSAGLSPQAVSDLSQQLLRIRESGVGVVLVEQNVNAALAIADRIYVLAQGRNRLEGPKHALIGGTAIADLYFGEAHDASAAAS